MFIDTGLVLCHSLGGCGVVLCLTGAAGHLMDSIFFSIGTEKDKTLFVLIGQPDSCPAVFRD